ncbi:MAG TPA: winged helix-turn-helix domain-containing protein [Nitrososphaeraceae archaeon]|jgi:predicted transcriptional regulator|nr:winged helix-turn-helix domain-containing protein [Nitrososphaeraceae archaeon]
MGNRSSIDIVSHVLEAANGGASKNKIMHRALLSYNQMKEYVNFLTQKGLLVHEYHQQQGEVQMYRTTEKGLRFLAAYNQLDDIIKEEVERQVSVSPQLQMWMQGEKEEGKFGLL